VLYKERLNFNVVSRRPSDVASICTEYVMTKQYSVIRNDMCNTNYGRVNKFQESLISSDAYKRKETSAHISFLAQQMDFDSKPTKCSFTDAHNVVILSHKGLLCSYANRLEDIHTGSSQDVLRRTYGACFPSDACVYEWYAYMNCWQINNFTIRRSVFRPVWKAVKKKLRHVCPSARTKQLCFPLEVYSLSLDYRLDDLGFDSWQKKDFSLFRNLYTGYWAYPVSYSWDTGSSFPGGKATGG
jgi:hypothetical protein